MIQSEAFGRTFWLDGDDNFKTAPTNIDSTVDYNSFDYVCDWTDWDGVNINELLNIHKFCILNKTEYAGSLTHREVN